LDLEVDSQRMIVAAKLTGRGCLPFLELLVTWRPKLKGSLDALQIPDGDGHSAILLREAILKVQGRWFFPYGEEELCHCRAIPTAKVDAAIVGGCKNVKSVSRETSAGTSCGTCRTDIEAIIKYRHAK
jgi:bacterioferritin-associated ferredoxin